MHDTLWKLINHSLREECPKTEFFSGPYFPVSSPNTEKHGPEKTSYLDTFHAVIKIIKDKSFPIEAINVIESLYDYWT